MLLVVFVDLPVERVQIFYVTPSRFSHVLGDFVDDEVAVVAATAAVDCARGRLGRGDTAAAAEAAHPHSAYGAAAAPANAFASAMRRF